MNKLKKAVFGVAVATGVMFSSMAPAWAVTPSYEVCLAMQEKCHETGNCNTFLRLCYYAYGLE